MFKGKRDGAACPPNASALPAGFALSEARAADRKESLPSMLSNSIRRETVETCKGVFDGVAETLDRLRRVTMGAADRLRNDHVDDREAF